MNRGIVPLLGLSACLVLSGCSPFALLNSASPSRCYDRLAAFEYGTDPRQTIDVYVPGSAAVPAPVVVFFYGGGWDEGRKENYRFVAASLARAGMVVMIPDYRLYPEVRFPAFVEDGAAAVAWAFENAGRHGGDPGRLYLMGHSAGAHIAALLALDAAYLGAHGLAPADLAGWIGLSGPYDFLPLQSGRLKAIFPEPVRGASQPIRHAGPEAPPTLLIHGGDDRTVYPSNSRNLAASLGDSGVGVTLHIYGGAGHARIVAALAPPLEFLADTLDDTLEFIERAEGSPAADDRSARAAPAWPAAGK